MSLVEWWPDGGEKSQEEEGEKDVNVVEFGGGACRQWDLCAVEVSRGEKGAQGGEDGESGWKVVSRRRKRGQPKQGVGRCVQRGEMRSGGGTGKAEKVRGTDGEAAKETRTARAEEERLREEIGARRRREGGLSEEGKTEATEEERRRGLRRDEVERGVRERREGRCGGGRCGEEGCEGGRGIPGRWRTQGGRGNEPDEYMMVELGPRFIGAVDCGEPTIGMTFQVAAVKKALASVWRICRAGNVVQFGDDPEDCFVRNKESGRKIRMEKKGGSYVIKVEFVRRKGEKGDGEWESLGRETVTVDSGAEESVCPMGWGADFGMKVVAPGKEMRMVSAGGGEMRHYGSRKVTIRATGF